MLKLQAYSVNNSYSEFREYVKGKKVSDFHEDCKIIWITIFSEIVKLVKLILRTPMSTADAENKFSLRK